MIKRFFSWLPLLLSGCFMVGPDYKEPIKPVVQHWKTDNSSVSEKPFLNPKWWQVFDDPILTKMVTCGYRHNLDLQSAGISVLQARAQLARATGELYPQQQVMTGNYTYNRLGGTSLQSVLPQQFDTAMLGFSTNWEIDFWGKYKRAIQSQNATFLASIAAYDSAIVTLTADIAAVYIKIRTTQEQIKIVNTNIDVQRTGLRIAKSRYNEGQASLVDVEQAQTELSETQANLPSLLSELQTQKDAMSVLLGQVPNQLDPLLKKSIGIPKAPSSVAVGIPKEALGRRPDIHQARLEAVSQSAVIGATKANLYPALALNGTFVFAANNIGTQSISDLFNWSNRSITAGPVLNWPILNYGQITNAVRVEDAKFQKTLLNYINLVLKAEQEVQDSITAYIEAKNAAQHLRRANQSAILAFKLALIRYKEGETDFTPVLNAEQQQLRVQTSLTKAEGDIPLALVAIYRSLGGGWDIRKGHDVVPCFLKREMAKRTNWGGLLAQQNHAVPNTGWQRIRQLYLPTW